jgi:hypothetical protein
LPGALYRRNERGEEVLETFGCLGRRAYCPPMITRRQAGSMSAESGSPQRVRPVADWKPSFQMSLRLLACRYASCNQRPRCPLAPPRWPCYSGANWLSRDGAPLFLV